MDGVMRIGELSRRTGVSPELLRAWEQRYGLLRPTRTQGGFRLYSTEDERRVRRTAALIADGMSAAEAARLAVEVSDEPPTVLVSGPATDPRRGRPLVEDLASRLREALDNFDAAGSHAAMDRLFGAVSVEFALTEVLIPYLHELGARWADGTATVAQEHFASQLIRGRLLGVVRDWGSGGASRAVLAGMPGEAHDLGLVLLGVLIAGRGWRVTFLGADTPLDTVASTVRTLRPSLVVLATYDAALFHQHSDAVSALAVEVPVAVSAPVPERAVTDTGARALVPDIGRAAETLAPR